MAADWNFALRNFSQLCACLLLLANLCDLIHILLHNWSAAGGRISGNLNSSIYALSLIKENCSKQPRFSQVSSSNAAFIILAVWKFNCTRCANIFWHCLYSFCLYSFYSNAVSVYFNDFIFSITHSGFNQKSITFSVLYL